MVGSSSWLWLQNATARNLSAAGMKLDQRPFYVSNQFGSDKCMCGSNGQVINVVCGVTLGYCFCGDGI